MYKAKHEKHGCSHAGLQAVPRLEFTHVPAWLRHCKTYDRLCKSWSGFGSELGTAKLGAPKKDSHVNNMHEWLVASQE